MAVKIKVKVFFVVTLCNVELQYQHFGGPCCHQLQDKMHDDGRRT